MCARAASMALVAAWVVTRASSPRHAESAPRRRPARRSGPSSTACVSSHRAAQVGLQVVGVGVEIGEAGRELPPSRRHGRSPSSRLRSAHRHRGPSATGPPPPSPSQPAPRRPRAHRPARFNPGRTRPLRPATSVRRARPLTAGSVPAGRRRARQRAGRAVDVHPGETWQCPCRAGQPAEPAAAEHTQPVFHGFATAADAKGVPADDRGHVAVLAVLAPAPPVARRGSDARTGPAGAIGNRRPVPLPRTAHAPRSAAPCR